MSLDPDKLTKEQRAFLIFHAETPAPHHWAWLGPKGERAAGPPPWAKLRAWRQSSPGGWCRRVTITGDGFRAIPREWWDAGRSFVVSAAGRAALGFAP